MLDQRQLVADMKAADTARAGMVAKIAAPPVEALPTDPRLMQAGIAGGAAACKVNCVQSHGAGAAGFGGYRTLNRDYRHRGGTLAEIEYILRCGVGASVRLLDICKGGPVNGNPSAVPTMAVPSLWIAFRMGPGRRSHPIYAFRFLIGVVQMRLELAGCLMQ